MVAHWHSGLGWPLMITVSATLVCSIVSLILPRRRD
jgi:hypothetical protein